MSSSPNEARQVLVAVDGSPASLQALLHGQRMAVLLGADLVAVSAWQSFRHVVLPPRSTHPRDAAEQLITNSVVAAFRGADMPKVTALTVEGDPAENLIRLSRDAEMLVVGSRGHAGLSGALLGSVSNACAAHAHCPVLVVHASAANVTASPTEDHQAMTTDQRIVVTL